jgi:phage shock protein A
MRQSEFDKLNATLDRTEFAVKELRKKVDELHRKATLAKTLEEMVALELEAAELKQQLRKIGDAVHTGDPAPHLTDQELKACPESRCSTGCRLDKLAAV